MKTRKRFITVVVVLVFLMSIVIPMIAYAADAYIKGSYRYVRTGKEVGCGTITVKKSDGEGHDTVVIRLALPDSVEFRKTPAVSDWVYDNKANDWLDPRTEIDSSSGYYEVELRDGEGLVDGDFNVTFTFSDKAELTIDKKFAGNLNVEVEVIGLGSDGIVWTEVDSITIAKIAGAVTVNNGAVDDEDTTTKDNGTVDDQDTITATFTVGDEGVAVLNSRTLVQVNLLCDVLGLQKSWDAASKTAYFAKDGKVVAFPMGENAIYINGVKLPIDQGGMIINDFTYATLRGLQLAFGGELDWDNDTKTATFVFNK